MNVQGKRFLVVGLGLSGRAALRLLEKEGAEVYGADDAWERLDLPRGLNRYNGEPLDAAILSPGLPPTHPLVAELREKGVPCWGELDFAMEFLQGQRCIAVTGTNGKTTTTLLIAHALGEKAHALGNVGRPLSDYIVQGQDPDDTLVIELSSYQLETLSGPRFDAGLILNITPDHLDRYGTMAVYIAAKRRLIDCMKEGHHCYVEAETRRSQLAVEPVLTYGYSRDSHVWSDGEQVLVNETVAFKWPASYRNRGGPDVDNALAAFAVCHSLAVDGATFVERLGTFKKPPHRMEFVREINGVLYYNDSKGTNVEAVLKAVESLPVTLVLIAGGREKGASYSPWVPAFAGKVKAVVALGEAAPNIANELGGAYPVSEVESLEAAVKQASSLASAGDAVLLSPGCSSFDMFQNYEERGQLFKALVHSL